MTSTVKYDDYGTESVAYNEDGSLSPVCSQVDELLQLVDKHWHVLTADKAWVGQYTRLTTVWIEMYEHNYYVQCICEILCW